MKKQSRYWAILFLSAILLAASALFFAGEGQAAKAGKKEQKKEAPAPMEKSPVRFEDRDLFFISSRVLSLSPKDRAEIISKKIRKIAKDPFIEPSGIATVPQEAGVDIVAGDIILMTVTEADARQAGIPVATLALENAGSIRKALTEYRKATSWEGILLGVLYTVPDGRPACPVLRPQAVRRLAQRTGPCFSGAARPVAGDLATEDRRTRSLSAHRGLPQPHDDSSPRRSGF